MASITRTLCENLSKLTLKDVPEQQITRAKYLILDGIACALVGAHLPHSEKAANAIFAMESGTCSVIGYPNKLTPASAALLNSTFIQGFELDDWHSEAPLHSNSLLIPSLLAAAEHQGSVSGSDFLLAMIAGYETGPRVGNALWGRDILAKGWHSGAVFGPAAVVAAVGNLYHFNPDTFEDAFGIACTQACGLMSAQFESEVKRMQHGFAARNGLFASLLAKSGYVGIKRVFEREYGGFLFQFSAGNGQHPQYKADELNKGFGEKWQLDHVCLKPYSSMAATHGTVDCIRALQEEHADLPNGIDKIEISLDEPMFHHGGFEVKRPLLVTGAQMSVAYVAATQLVDKEVLVKQFSSDKLDRDEVWSLVDKVKCSPGQSQGATEVRITLESGDVLTKKVDSQRGVNPPLSNEETVEKYRNLGGQVIDQERLEKIEQIVLNIEKVDDLSKLIELLTPETKNIL